jgi:hypothetical protein
MIRGTVELLNFAKEDTTIVPGHGPAGTKAMMRDYRIILVEARERMAKLNHSNPRGASPHDRSPKGYPGQHALANEPIRSIGDTHVL